MDRFKEKIKIMPYVAESFLYILTDKEFIT
jgi:hypothetical protein